MLTVVSFTCACSISERALPEQNGGDEPPWFCELAENGTDWQCIRSAEAAQAPKPARLPQRAAALQAEPPAARSPRPPAPVTADPMTDAQEADSQVPEQSRPAEDVPLHVALAYRPGQAQRLIDLPDEFWAVQLAAFASPEQLSEYARQHELRGMSAARIARNNTLFYVLLLGVYETRENAERAAATVPEALSVEPWIRSLGSLQRAMRAGELLAPAG